MSPIVRKDSIVLKEDPSRIFKVLLDLPSYPLWWPKRIRFKVGGPLPPQPSTRVRVSNGPLVQWIATITEVEKDRKISFHYGEGAWEGTAGWSLASVPGGVEVSYSIDIVPVHRWLKFLGALLDLGKVHSKETRVILRDLRDYLTSNRAK